MFKNFLKLKSPLKNLRFLYTLRKIKENFRRILENFNKIN